MMHVITHERRASMGCNPIRTPNPDVGSPKAVVCINLSTGETIEKPNYGALDIELGRGKNYTSGIIITAKGWIGNKFYVCDEEKYDPDVSLKELKERCRVYWEAVKCERERKAAFRKEGKALALAIKKAADTPQKVDPNKIIIRLTSAAKVLEFPSIKEAGAFLGTGGNYVTYCRRIKRVCCGYTVEAYYLGELIDPAIHGGQLPVIKPVLAIKDGVSVEFKNVSDCADALGIERQRVYHAARNNTQSMGYYFKYV